MVKFWQYFIMLRLQTQSTAVAARSSTDGKWYRARIDGNVTLDPATGDSHVIVFFVDWGNRDLVPLADVKPLLSRFGLVPPLALRCRIMGEHIVAIATAILRNLTLYIYIYADLPQYVGMRMRCFSDSVYTGGSMMTTEQVAIFNQVVSEEANDMVHVTLFSLLGPPYVVVLGFHWESPTPRKVRLLPQGRV